MSTWFDVSTAAKRFRLIAVIEAITWALLLIGMGLKYGADMESATMVPGSLHGAAFIVYLLITVLSARSLNWSWKVTLLALVASVPPFFSVIFEIWARRTGRLGELSAPAGEAAVSGESAVTAS